MNRASSLALPTAIGVVAGLRFMTAPAVLVWAARRGRIQIAGSALASLVLGAASSKVTKLAISELLADKLPFTPARTNPGPLALRVAAGAGCGAAVSASLRQPVWEGALAGALGALAGTFAGYYARKAGARRVGSLTAAVLEDTIAIGLGAMVVWRVAQFDSPTIL